MQAHVYLYTHIYTFFQLNLYHSKSAAKALDFRTSEMMLDSEEIQKPRETANASIRTESEEMVWNIPLIWTD